MELPEQKAVQPPPIPTDATSSVQPARRWRPRFSLRTFLIATTLVAIVVGYRLDQVRQQRDGLAALKDAQVEMMFNDGSSRTVDSGSISWVGGVLGRDGPAYLGFRGPIFTDEIARHARPLTMVRRVVVQNTQLTEDGFRFLDGMRLLDSLHLEGGVITDRVVERDVSRLPALRIASFDHTGISDAGIAPLVSLPNLISLSVWHSSITNEALRKHLAQMSQLEGLSLLGTQCTIEGLDALRGLPNLQYLEFWRHPGTWAAHRELLETTNVDLDQAPLEDVIEYLSDLHKIPMRLDEFAPDSDGGRRKIGQIPITLNSKGLALSLTLDRILKPHGLDYVLRDGAIWITTNEGLASHRQLVERLKQLHPKASIDIDWQGP